MNKVLAITILCIFAYHNCVVLADDHAEVICVSTNNNHTAAYAACNAAETALQLAVGLCEPMSGSTYDRCIEAATDACTTSVASAEASDVCHCDIECSSAIRVAAFSLFAVLARFLL